MARTKAKMRTATLTLDVTYDGNKTDAEAIASALDRLLETALSTDGILDEYGNPSVGEFYVAFPASASVKGGK